MRKKLVFTGVVILLASLVGWIFRDNLADVFQVRALQTSVWSWLSSGTTLIAGVGVIAFYIRRMLNGREIKRAYQRSGAPRLNNKQRPVRVDVEPPGPLRYAVAIVDVVEDAYYALRGRRVDREYIRGGGAAKIQLATHKYYAAQVEGLSLLSIDTQRAIYWEIVVNQMEQVGDTHIDALNEARTERGKSTNPHVRALFDPAKLQAADLTPRPGQQTTYFTKYFQPLLRAFSEGRFVRPANPEDSNAALMAHLGLLNAGRVAALRYEEAYRNEVPREVADQRLCRTFTTNKGKGQERASIRTHNSKAARSVLIVCDAYCLDLAGAFDLNNDIAGRFVGAQVAFDEWKAAEVPSAMTHVSLWQQRSKPGTTQAAILAMP